MTTDLVPVYGIIYKCTNLINGKIYIGQTTKSLRKRKLAHENVNCKKPSIIQLAIQKYGKENFRWEIIDSSSNQDNLNFKEKLYIALYNSLAKNKMGYNVSKGGKGTYENIWNNYSEERKNEVIKNRRKGQLLMSDYKKQKRAENFSDSYRNKTLEEKSKLSEKLSKAAKNRSEDTIKSCHNKLSAANKRGKNPLAKHIQCIETNEIFSCVKDAVDKLDLKAYKEKFVYKAIQESARNNKMCFDLNFTYDIDFSKTEINESLYFDIREKYKYRQRGFVYKIIEINQIFNSTLNLQKFIEDNNIKYNFIHFKKGINEIFKIDKFTIIRIN